MAKNKRKVTKRVGLGSSTLRDTSSRAAARLKYRHERGRSQATHVHSGIVRRHIIEAGRAFKNSQDTSASAILEISKGKCDNALNNLLLTKKHFSVGVTHAKYHPVYASHEHPVVSRRGETPAAKARFDAFSQTEARAYDALVYAIRNFRKRCVIR